MTLEELHLECSLPAIPIFSKTCVCPLKKTLHASEQEREDVAKARAEWMAGQSQLGLNRLVFIDEVGAKTNMTRLYGRAEKGTRVVDLAPHGHWCRMAMISSIHLDGSIACMAVDGSTTGDVFHFRVSLSLAHRDLGMRVCGQEAIGLFASCGYISN
ncbi:MAG: transposase [Kiritimatiellales bacterium]